MPQHRPLPLALLKAMRPHQWIKNVLVFGGFAFTGRWHQWTSGVASQRTPAVDALILVCYAFVIFCCISSAGYLVNDIKDVEADRKHPDKCHRPIASGDLPVPVAIVAAIVLFAIGLGWAAYLSQRGGHTSYFGCSALFYAALTVWYSFQLKSLVIIDVMTIAAEFVVRVIAGCWVIPEPPSPWIVTCTLFGALYIALCKRRGELIAIGDQVDTRPVLAKYHSDQAEESYLLDQMIMMAGAGTIITYSLYTFFRPLELGQQGEYGKLMFTIPCVVYGVFRYLYLVHKQDIGQKPERLFLDRGIILDLLLWGAIILGVTCGRTL